MQILMTPIGSVGDVLPYVGLGRELLRRGHRVTIIAGEFFRPLIEPENIEFVPTYREEDVLDIIQDDRMAHRWEGFQLFERHVLDGLERTFDVLADRLPDDQTVLMAPLWGFAARIASEHFDVPLVTVNLQPLCFFSIHDRVKWPWMPDWIARGALHIGDRYLHHRVMSKLQPLRRRLGLRPIQRLMRHWAASPDLVLGFFPEWFTPPQPDWPPRTRLVGFPFYLGALRKDPPPELDAFLAGGDPPLVFSQSSCMQHARRYYAESIEAARRLGRRAVLLTPYPDQIPQPLPSDVAHFEIVPLDYLLPKAAAHIHHGGIGTIAHTLAAGIPQVTVPQVFDTPNNSNRLLRLGVSANITPGRYRASRLTSELGRLLNSNEVARRCRDYAERCRKMDAFSAAASAVESLVAWTPESPPSPVSAAR